MTKKEFQNQILNNTEQVYPYKLKQLLFYLSSLHPK